MPVKIVSETMEAYIGAAEDWRDIEPEWMDELPALRPEPALNDYAESITPDDWEIVERVARRYARNSQDREQASHSLDGEIASAEAALNELRARQAEICKPFDRREECLMFKYEQFLRAFTAAATAHTKERYKDVGRLRLSVAKNPPGVRVIPGFEDKVLEWARVHCAEAVKETLLTTPIKALLQRYKLITEPSVYVVDVTTGETVPSANYPPHCSLEQSERFSVKVR